MSAERRTQRRQLLLLGAMVARAGLADADRAFLLGGLTNLAKIYPGTPEYRRLHTIGVEEFHVSARSADRSTEV